MTHHLKRLLDLLTTVAGLVILSPLMAVLAVCIGAKMGRPVLFRQVRPGYRGKPFTILKFRTMRDSTGADGQPLPDALRLTRLGSLLRRTSLDELPQLWNVARGEMSLVGPRPLRMAYLPRYTPAQARRHEVLPGLTGWAQVKGRNALSWEERFALDVWYVDHWSLSLDGRILWATVATVLKREGVSQAGEATMSEFRGEEGGAHRTSAL